MSANKVEFLTSWLNESKSFLDMNEDTLDDVSYETLHQIRSVIRLEVSELQSDRDFLKQSRLSDIIAMIRCILQLRSGAALNLPVVQEPQNLRALQLQAGKIIESLEKVDLFPFPGQEDCKVPTTMRSELGAMSPSAYD